MYVENRRPRLALVNLYSLVHGLFLSTGVLILILVIACAVSGVSLGVLYSGLPSQPGWHTVDRTAGCDALSTRARSWCSSSGSSWHESRQQW